MLRADTPEEKGRLLEELAGPGKVEQDIVKELSKVKPLGLFAVAIVLLAIFLVTLFGLANLAVSTLQ